MIYEIQARDYTNGVLHKTIELEVEGRKAVFTREFDSSTTKKDLFDFIAEMMTGYVQQVKLLSYWEHEGHVSSSYVVVDGLDIECELDRTKAMYNLLTLFYPNFHMTYRQFKQDPIGEIEAALSKTVREFSYGGKLTIEAYHYRDFTWKDNAWRMKG